MISPTTGPLEQADDTLAQNGVSIIMPAYNLANYIGLSIQSVLEQAYANFELIVVDDGSPDNTDDIVSSFDDPRIRYIRQENMGLAGARNTGLRASRGRYILLLDADDLTNHDQLCKMVAYLQAHPHVDAVYCQAQFIDGQGNLLPQRTGSPVPPERFRETMLRANFMTPNCLLAHKYCYDEAGYFDTKIVRGEEDVWLRFAERYRIEGIPYVLAKYRVIANSMSSLNPRLNLESALAIRVKHANMAATEMAQWPAELQESYARCYLTAAIEFLQIKEVDLAFAYIVDAIHISPALLKADDLFYEVACGYQPRGFRGDSATLNIDRSQELIERLLAKLRHDPKLELLQDEDHNWARLLAYRTLAHLSYSHGSMSKSRGFSLQALKVKPDSNVRIEMLRHLLKSVIGKPLLDKVKGFSG